MWLWATHGSTSLPTSFQMWKKVVLELTWVWSYFNREKYVNWTNNKWRFVLETWLSLVTLDFCWLLLSNRLLSLISYFRSASWPFTYNFRWMTFVWIANSTALPNIGAPIASMRETGQTSISTSENAKARGSFTPVIIQFTVASKLMWSQRNFKDHRRKCQERLCAACCQMFSSRLNRQHHECPSQGRFFSSV